MREQTNRSKHRKVIENNLAGLKKESDNYKAQNKAIPQSLMDDTKASQERQTKLQGDLEKSKADKAVIDARFDADKARYKELSGK